MNTADGIIYVLADSLQSSAEHDLDSNPANAVDGLFAIARAIEKLASAVREIDQSITHHATGPALE